MVLREYIKVLLQRRRFIFWNTFIITCIAIIISLIIPKKYTSRALLLPPLPETEFFLPEMTSAISGLSVLRGRFGLATPSDLYAKILQSDRVMDGVIKDCDLMKVYKTKTRWATYKALSSATDISVTPEGMIIIATTDKSPELAQKMTASYIRNLDELNKSLVMSIGKRNRIFLEKRLQEVEENLKLIEDSLRRFQELHKTISIEKEIEPVLQTVANLKAQIIASEIQLGILRKYATDDNPEVIKINSELAEFNRKLNAIEYKGDNKHFGVGFSIPFKQVPTITLEFARLKRDMMIQEKLFTLLTEQYEKAKIQEVKDTPTINVLEEPRVPEHKSYPKRSTIVIAVFIISLVMGVIMSFFLNWTDNLTPEEKEEWQKVLALLRVKLSSKN